MNKIRFTLIVLSLLGVCISGYALYLHYATSSGVCHFNDMFNCDLVNKSDYAEILGIPVAALGIVGYALLWAGAILSEKKRLYALLTLLASIGGLFFALYLTSLEIFVIKAYCIVCLSSQLVIILTTILSIILFRQTRIPSGMTKATSYDAGRTS